MTVKPVDTDDVITSTTVLPKVFQKQVVGNRHLPFKVVCHQVYDTLVLRILVIRLQAPKHNHLCPKFAFPIAFVDRTEITVRLAAGKYAFNPVFGFFYHLRIIQNICQTTIPFEPIGNFLPTMVPTGRKPGIVILFQPSADFPQMSGQAIALQLQKFPYPTLRANAAYRQFYKVQRTKRGTVTHIIGIDSMYIRSVHHRHRTDRRDRSTSRNRNCQCHKKEGSHPCI